jgi:hypothetical protein
MFSSGVVQIPQSQVSTLVARTAMPVPAATPARVFFQPAGWSRLFNVPIREITDRICDATTVQACEMREMWNRLGEESDFESRIRVADEFLIKRLALVSVESDTSAAANYLYRKHGTLRISALAHLYSIGLRQFERKFEREIGIKSCSFRLIRRVFGNRTLWFAYLGFSTELRREKRPSAMEIFEVPPRTYAGLAEFQRQSRRLQDQHFGRFCTWRTMKMRGH